MSLLQRHCVRGNGAGGPAAQRAGRRQSAGATGGPVPTGIPNPELIERPRRRRFTSEYKLAILREADGLSRPRRYRRPPAPRGPQLCTWRRQRDQGVLEALSGPRGRKPAEPLQAENAELRRRLIHTKTELEKARRVIEVQGNVCALLGELHGPRGAKPEKSTDW